MYFKPYISIKTQMELRHQQWKFGLGGDVLKNFHGHKKTPLSFIFKNYYIHKLNALRV